MLDETSRIKLSTCYGQFDAYHLTDGVKQEGLVIVSKPWEKPTFIRLQSSCIFSESFGSNDCDCALQLKASLREIAARGGVIIYLYQEGRGLGLAGKFHAVRYQQEKGITTADAFKLIGRDIDVRNYNIAIAVLKQLAVPCSILLATNNPRKVAFLEEAGFKVTRHQLEYEITPKIRDYLSEKTNVLKHHAKP